MESSTEPKSEQGPTDAASHVAGAHEILKSLQEKLGEHPEIGAAILKLEMALNVLAVRTNALL
jgi:hypothetical protein